MKRRDLGAWVSRWSWDIARWFHRFDADHVKPHFVIYLFEPGVKADLALYTLDDLPAVEGRPYRCVWDARGELERWTENDQCAAACRPRLGPGVVHEDERFWAWMFYVWQHIDRGEYYHVASEIAALRNIVEQWGARLAGTPRFEHRRLEQRPDSGADLERLGAMFPDPERGVQRRACLSMIELQNELRSRVSERVAPEWTTTASARERITALIRAL